MNNLNEALACLQSNDIPKILLAVTELRERIEIVNSPDFSNFLANLFTSLKDVILSKVNIQFIENDENKIRHTVLEIFNKFPSSSNLDILKPHVLEVLNLSMRVLTEDNEDNALVAQRIIFDLHKVFRPALENQVQAFLDFVLKAYKNFSSSMKTAFAQSYQNSSEQNISQSGQNYQVNLNNSQNMLLKSTESFKVLTECPLIVMLLFQLYPKFIKPNIHQLVPFMMNTLAHKAPRIAARIQRSRYKDLIAAQAKTLSFLTYLLRGYSDMMKQYDDQIAKCVLSLLHSCPPEAVSTRKELLVATRQILNTEFRKGFFPHFDDLLNEKLLLGVGKQASQTLRPLVYSTIADLVHHVRDSLSVSQLSRIIYLFSRNIYDVDLSVAVQSTSVRLLLTLVEKICAVDVICRERRSLLFIIFQTLIDKFNTLHSQIDRMDKSEEFLRLDSEMIESGAGKLMQSINLNNMKAFSDTSNKGDNKLLSNDHSIFGYRINLTGEIDSHSSGILLKSLSDSIFSGIVPVHNMLRDLRQLIKTLIWGIKQIVSHLLSGRFNNSESYTQREIFTVSEIEYLKKYFRLGLESIKIFFINNNLSKPINQVLDNEGSKDKKKKQENDNKDDTEQKEILELFASSFISLGHSLFKSIICIHIDFIVEISIKDSVFLSVIQFYLSNSSLTSSILDVLLNYSISRLPYLSHPISNLVQPLNSRSKKNNLIINNSQRSSVILRIFKMSFTSLNIHPENEKVLRPRLNSIIHLCLRFAHKSRVSVNYYFVLKTLFKSISGGKFDNSYQELSSSIPLILNGLLQLLERTNHETVQNIIIELCLTMPTRLQTLIKHLPILLSLLIRALNSKGELPNLGLRTFEFWIENIGLEDLKRSIDAKSGLQKKLMNGICIHLKPAPYPYGMLALRILGKLGGINRNFLRDVQLNLSQNEKNKYYSHSQKIKLNISSVVDNKLIVSNLELHHYLEVAVEIMNKLYSKAPVEAEIFSLLSTYPEIQENILTEPSNVYSDQKDKQSESFLILDNSISNILNYDSLSECMKKLNSETNNLLLNGSDNIKSSSLNMIFLYISQSSYFKNIKQQPILESHETCVESILNLLPENSTNMKDNFDSETNLMYRLIFTLLISSSDFTLKHRIFEFLSGICFHFSRILNSFKPGHKHSYVDMKSKIFYIVHRSIFACLSDFRPLVYQVGVKFLHLWIHSINYLPNKQTIDGINYPQELLKDIFDDLVIQVEFSSSSTKYPNRMAAIRFIDEILKLFDYTWVQQYSCRILYSIFNFIKNIDFQFSITSLTDALSVLERFINSPFLASRIEEINELFVFLIKSLIHQNTLTRLASKWSMLNIAKLKGLNLIDIFNLHSDLFNTEITNFDNSSLPFLENLPRISCISYLLSKGFKIVGIENIFDHLSSILEISDTFDNYPIDKTNGFRTFNCIYEESVPDENLSLELSYFPEKIPFEIQISLLCIKFISGALLYNSEALFKENYKGLGKKCISFLIKSLAVPWTEVVGEANHTLHMVLNNYPLSTTFLNFCPRESVLENIQPILNSLQNWQTLTVPLLKGIECAIKLVNDKSLSYLKDNIITILNIWLNPLNFNENTIWIPGEEQNIAAAIMNLFSILPIISSDFPNEPSYIEYISQLFYEFYNLVVKLEKTRTRYFIQNSIESPFIVPLLDFIVKYPAECIKIVILPSSIYQDEFLNLLLMMLDIPTKSQILIDLLLSPEVYNYIINALLDPSNTSSIKSDRDLISIPSSEPDPKRLKINEENLHITASSEKESKNMDPDVLNITRLNTLKLMHCLATKNPGMLFYRPEMLKSFKKIWLQIISELSEENVSGGLNTYRSLEILFLKQQILIYLSNCFTIHCRETKGDIETLLILINAFKLNLPVEFSSLQEFLAKEVPATWGIPTKRYIIRIFFPLLNDNLYPFELKIKTLQLLISPILLYSFNQKSEDLNENLFDDDTVKIIMYEGLGAESDRVNQINPDMSIQEFTSNNPNLFMDSSSIPLSNHVHENSGEQSAKTIMLKTQIGNVLTGSSASQNNFTDSLKFELLKIATIMIEYLGKQLTVHRKDLIKFAWNHLKSDDLATKNWAYVNVCRFIAVYDTPPKIIIQVYVALLRTYQAEYKELVRMAIDTLIPALPFRLNSSDFMKTMKWTKKIISDEGHTVLQLLHIWNIIIRHCDFFYSYRYLFVPQMVNSLSKLGLMSNCPAEYRHISIGITDVIVSWETYRLEKINSTNSHKDDEYTIYPNMVQLLANFLIRMGVLVASDKDINVMTLKTPCINIFSKLVKLFPMNSIKLTHLEKIILNILDSYNNQGKTRVKTPNSSIQNPHNLYQNDNSKFNSNSGQMNKNSSSQANTSIIFSEHVLLVIGNLLTIILDCEDGISPFISQNFTLIKDFLQPLFSFDSLLVQQFLQNFIHKLLKAHVSSMLFIGSNIDFYATLKELIELKLQSLIHEFDLKNRSDGQNISNEIFSSIQSTLVIIESVCNEIPSCIDGHGSNILKLNQAILIDHIRQVNASQRTGHQALLVSLQEHGQENDFSKFHPTHHMAIMSDTFSGITYNIASDNWTSSLYLGFKLCFKGFHNGYLEQYRQQIVSLIITVLDNSDSPLLINLIVDWLSIWIVRKRSPLTLSEQIQIVSKLSSFEKLSENSYIQLFVKITSMVETLLDSNDSCLLPKAKMITVLNQIKMNGLLSPHATFRKKYGDRIRPSLGCSFIKTLNHYINNDCSSFTMRYWTAALPGLYLNNFAKDHHFHFENQSFDSSKQLNFKDTFSSTHSYVLFLKDLNNMSSNSSIIVDSLDELCLSHFKCSDKTINHLLLEEWQNLKDCSKNEFIASLMDNTLKNRYKQSLNWPNYLQMTTYSKYEIGLNKVNSCSRAFMPKNLPQSLIRLVTSIRPIPKLPINYIVAISRNYSLPLESISILDNYLIAPDNLPSDTLIERSISAIYQEDLEDKDISSYVFCNMAKLGITHVAYSLEKYGYPEKANVVISNALKFLNHNKFIEEFGNTTTHSYKYDSEFLESKWIETSQSLAEWRILSEYSSEIGAYGLNIESFSMLSEWGKVKELRKYPSVIAQLERGSSKFKLIDIMLSIIDNNPNEADKLCAQSVQMSLLRWDQLPPFYHCSNGHKRLLHQFHQIIELRESVSLINEVTKCVRDKISPDIRGIVKAWKQRLPSHWENFSNWENIFSWRLNVFNNIFKILEIDQESNNLFDKKQLSWLNLKLASVATKKHLLSLSERLTNNFDLSSTQKHDHFEILKVKIINLIKTEKIEIRPDIYSNIDVSYFDNDQKINFLVLKSKLLIKMNLNTEANKTLSECIQLQNLCGKAWYTWGKLFLDKTEKDSVISHSDILSSVICVFKSIITNTLKAQYDIPRILILLYSCNDFNLSNLTEISSLFFDIPSWIWVPYSNILILLSKKFDFIFELLQKISFDYPQLAFYDYFAQNSNPDARADLIYSLFNMFKQKFWKVSSQHAHLVKLLVEDLAPDSLEYFLIYLEDLFFNLCNNFNYSLSALIDRDIINQLNSYLFSLSNNSNEHSNDIIQKFQHELGSIEFSCNKISYLIEFIIKWIDLLRLKITCPHKNFKRNSISNMFTGNMFALDFNSFQCQLEIPGFYNNYFSEPRPELHPLISKISTKYKLVKRNSFWLKQIKILGNDGKYYYFILNHKLNYKNKGEHAFKKVLSILDWSLKTFTPSRNRDMIIPSSISLNISSEFDLFSDIPDTHSLYEIYQINGDENVKDLNELFNIRKQYEIFFDESFSKISPEESSLQEIKIKANQVAFGMISSSLVADVVNELNPTAELLYLYKRHICANYGISASIQCLLGSSIVSPNQLNYHFNSARISVTGLLSSSTILQSNSQTVQTVFRFTRNMHSFIQPYMIGGILVLNLGLSFDSFCEHQYIIKNFIITQLLNSENETTTQTNDLLNNLKDAFDRIVSLSPSNSIHNFNLHDIKLNFDDYSKLDKNDSIDYKIFKIVLNSMSESTNLKLDFKEFPWL